MKCWLFNLVQQENVTRLGDKYSDCVPDDADWQDLRGGKVVKAENKRYSRKVRIIYLKMSWS